MLKTNEMFVLQCTISQDFACRKIYDRCRITTEWKAYNSTKYQLSTNAV